MFELAHEILSQPIPEELEVEGVGNYRQPRCPVCDSLEIAFEGLNEAVAYASAWLGVPLPLHDRGWRCRACGHSWEDETPPPATVDVPPAGN